MGKKKQLKWEKTQPIRFYGNIISSDFSKYQQPHWHYTQGKANMYLLLANEYQRLWIAERDELKRILQINDPTTKRDDVVKKYVQTFKSNYPTKKKEEKKLFKMKKFQNIPSRTISRQPESAHKNDKPQEEKQIK